MEHIHFNCLKEWLTHKDFIKSSEKENITTYSWRALFCELCRQKYEDSVENPFDPSSMLNIVEIPTPENNYLILES